MTLSVSRGDVVLKIYIDTNNVYLETWVGNKAGGANMNIANNEYYYRFYYGDFNIWSQTVTYYFEDNTGDNVVITAPQVWPTSGATNTIKFIVSQFPKKYFNLVLI